MHSASMQSSFRIAQLFPQDTALSGRAQCSSQLLLPFVLSLLYTSLLLYHWQRCFKAAPFSLNPFSEIVSCICIIVRFICCDLHLILGSLDLDEFLFILVYIKIHSVIYSSMDFDKCIESLSTTTVLRTFSQPQKFYCEALLKAISAFTTSGK